VVENDAPELVPEDLRSLAEPFWRKDRARTDRSRSGLGLALSCALAQRTGLELGFALDHGRFRAVLGPSR
jgi:signal transduction histidine kinase